MSRWQKKSLKNMFKSVKKMSESEKKLWEESLKFLKKVSTEERNIAYANSGLEILRLARIK